MALDAAGSSVILELSSIARRMTISYRGDCGEGSSRLCGSCVRKDRNASSCIGWFVMPFFRADDEMVELSDNWCTQYRLV